MNGPTFLRPETGRLGLAVRVSPSHCPFADRAVERQDARPQAVLDSRSRTAPGFWPFLRSACRSPSAAGPSASVSASSSSPRSYVPSFAGCPNRVALQAADLLDAGSRRPCAARPGTAPSPGHESHKYRAGRRTTATISFSGCTALDVGLGIPPQPRQRRAGHERDLQPLDLAPDPGDVGRVVLDVLVAEDRHHAAGFLEDLDDLAKQPPLRILNAAGLALADTCRARRSRARHRPPACRRPASAPSRPSRRS